MKNLFERKQAENVFQRNCSSLEKAEALVTCYMNGAGLSDIQSLIKNTKIENKLDISLNEAYIEVARLLNIRSKEAPYRMQVEDNTNLLIALHESEYSTLPCLVSMLGKQGDVLQVPTENHPEYVIRFSFNESQLDEGMSLERDDTISEALIQNNIQMCDDTFSNVLSDIAESNSITRIANKNNLSKRTVQIMYNAYLESQGIDATICPMCEGLGTYIEDCNDGYYECKSCSHNYYDTEAIQLHEKEVSSCPLCPAGSLHLNENYNLSCDNCHGEFIQENHTLLDVSQHLIEEFNYDDDDLDTDDNELDHHAMGCPECSGHVIDLGNKEYKCTSCKWTGDSTDITQYPNDSDDEAMASDDEYDDDDDVTTDDYELDDEDDEDGYTDNRPSESLKPISIIVPMNESYNCPECGSANPQGRCCGIKFLEAAEDMLIPPKDVDGDGNNKPLLDMDFSDGDDDVDEMVTSSSVGSSPEMGIGDDGDEYDEMGDIEDLGELGDQGQDDLDLDDEYDNDVEESDDDPDFEGYLDTMDNDPDGNPDYEDHFDTMVSEEDTDDDDDDELEEASNKIVTLRRPKPSDFV